MTHKFMNIAGVKDEKAFYKKFPNPEDFFKAHPDALPTYENGGSIHINPENKGKFNATKKATGKTTEELTHSSNPITKKRAVFAQNASYWKHAAWGAELGTNQFEGGPMPINSYPQGFKIPTTPPEVQPLNLNGQAFLGADGKPVSTTPSVWDTPQPLPQTPRTNDVYKTTPPLGTIPMGEGNPAWTNYPTTPGGTTQPIPTDPNRPNMILNRDYIPNKGEGQLNRGQVPNLTEGQKKWDKTAVKPYQDPQVKPPKNTSWNADGSAGDVALTALMAVDAFMPKEKIRRRYVRPEDMQSYNANTYGTGSQAISEYGSTLKGKKKAFWGAALSAVGGKAGVATVGNQAVGTASSGIMDTIKQGGGNLTNNIAESVAPLMQISHKADAEAQRINQAYLNGDLQDVSKLQAPQQFLPNQQPQYMANGGEMKFDIGGELQTGQGGNTKLKSYNPYDGGTMQFNGDSHEEGGIDIDFNGEKAEVEGGETAQIDSSGNMKILGNMKIAGTNIKYKTLSKRLSDKEHIADKLKNKGAILLNTANPDDPYERLAFNAGEAMVKGADREQKRLAGLKEHMGNMQEAQLEIAMEKKKAPDKVFKDGGTIYAEDGATLAPEGDPVYEEMLRKAAEKYGVSYEHMKKLVTTESNFNPTFESDMGAKGIMQFIPSTAKKYGVDKILTSKKPEDIQKVIDAGVKHFKELLDANNNDYTLASVAYNGGQKAIDFVRNKTKDDNLTGDEWVSFMEDRNKTKPTSKKHAWQNETLNYVKTLNSPDIEKDAPAFRDQYYNQTPKPMDGMFSGKFTVPTYDYTPKPTDIQTVEGDGSPIDLHQPPPTNKPSNARGISPLQFLGEGYAMATNQEEPVKAQLYTPELYQGYQVSFQDRLNQNHATFNAIQKQLAYDPTALSTLAGQEYSANSSVLADEFRTNQTIANDIINKNVSLLNEAEKTNLGILDQQYTRQTQAKANTKRINQDALSSISSKLLQKEASNNQLRVYENLYQNYSFDPHTGKALFQGPKQGEEKPIDYGIPQPITAGQPSKTVVKTNPAGQKTTTDTYEPFDPNAQFMESLGIKPKKKTASTPISIYQMFKNNRR